MKRNVFDVVGQSHSGYDYKGREFSIPETAFHLGELIALDLKLSPQGAWVGFSVNARDSHGRQFFNHAGAGA